VPLERRRLDDDGVIGHPGAPDTTAPPLIRHVQRARLTDEQQDVSVQVSEFNDASFALRGAIAHLASSNHGHGELGVSDFY
jgi:hypothetical protein